MKFSRPFPNPPRRILPSLPRRAAFAVFGALCALRRSGGGAPDGNRVIIYEPFGMGDALLLQPLAKAFLAAGREVVVATRAEWLPLFPRLDNLKLVPIAPDYASHDPSRKRYSGIFSDIARTAAALRGYADRATGIDPRGDPRAVLVLRKAGCARVETLSKYYASNDCPLPRGAADLMIEPSPSVTRRVLSAEFAPAGAPYGRPDLSHLAAGVAAEPAVTGLVPLASWRGKMWPADNWKKLVGELAARGAQTVVLCGPGESAAAREAVGVDGVEIREARDVPELVRNVAACRRIVCVNTAAMHIADALDIPLVDIDGASRLPLWAPEGERSIVLHHQDEVPAAPYPVQGDGLAAQRYCMARVTPEEVLAALDSLSGEGGAA